MGTKTQQRSGQVRTFQTSFIIPVLEVPLSFMPSSQSHPPVPRRPYGRAIKNSRLPKDVPILGLGCSSFSTFFWTRAEQEALLMTSGSASTSTPNQQWTADGIDKNHPKVREWIETILYAVRDCGITLLDTAPWYGHGTSEVVIGWAMEELLLSSANKSESGVDRADLIINTKVGRYEADPARQFDFSKETTILSVERSLKRMKCQYIDVLQLHDPEFAPSLETLLQETIPAMMECRKRGYCKALGMTGYPLVTQYQILQRSKELVVGFDDDHDSIIWDQSLTYGHYNLVNTTLFTQPMPPTIPTTTTSNNKDTEDTRNDAETPQQYPSFADYCQRHAIGLLAAAPLNMGLLTNTVLPDWHPASNDLKEACAEAASICTNEFHVDIATLAIVFALAKSQVPCTILGMKNVEQVRASYQVAMRFAAAVSVSSDNNMTTTTQNDNNMLQQVLTEQEYKAWKRIKNPDDGPFATVWKNGSHTWDSVQGAKKFWQQVVGQEQTDWHWQ
jgi:L-galactose dehydrogenase